MNNVITLKGKPCSLCKEPFEKTKDRFGRDLPGSNRWIVSNHTLEERRHFDVEIHMYWQEGMNEIQETEVCPSCFVHEAKEAVTKIALSINYKPRSGGC